MKKRKNLFLRTAMFAAAVGLGTYIYKKFSNPSNNDSSDSNDGIIEIDELGNTDYSDKGKDNSTVTEDTLENDTSDKEDTNFQINLEETAMENSSEEENK